MGTAAYDEQWEWAGCGLQRSSLQRSGSVGEVNYERY